MLATYFLFDSSTKIRISTDHPFNPSVHLAENNSSVDDSASSPFAFKHSEYVYNPVNALNVLAKASDSSSVNTKEKRGTGGRRHYDTPDGMSTTSGISARTMKSGYGNHAPMALEIPYGNEYIQGLQRRRGKSMGGSGHNSANNSPRRLNYGGNQGGYYPNFGDRGGGNVSPYQESFIPMNQGAPPIHPGYIQQQNYMHYIAQQQVYQQMQAMQYHASQASSYGSNYSGHQSPMAQSPINPSYMNQPMGYYAPPMVGGLPHVPMAMNMPRPYGTESSSADHVSQGADDSSSPVAHQSGDNE